MNPFRLSANWIFYAHQPAAEDGQPSAVELCDLITERDYVLVPADRLDLIREIIDVAGLYSSSYGEDWHENFQAAKTARLIKRARKYIEKAREDLVRQAGFDSLQKLIEYEHTRRRNEW